MGPKSFLPRLTKMFFVQNWEKIEERKWDCLMDENAHVHLHMGFVHIYSINSFFFFSFARTPFFLLNKCVTFLFYLMRT